MTEPTTSPDPAPAGHEAGATAPAVNRGTLRRPPSAPAQWATVTRLGAGARPPGSEQASAAAVRVEGALALAASPAVPPVGAPDLRVVPDRAVPTEAVGPAEPVREWAARFAQAVVDVLAGDRPVTQLLRWTSSRVYADLGRRQQILARGTTTASRSRRIRPQVRSVHVCHPSAEAAEVSVHVRHGQRSRALAARLERRNGRWQCTALELG